MKTFNNYIERGLAYFKGDGVPQDYEQAYYWLNEAKRKGLEDESDTLSKMYASGFGVPYDPQEGAAFLSEVAKHRPGEPESAANINAVCARYNDDNEFDELMVQAPNPDRCVVCGQKSLVSSKRFPGAKLCAAEHGGCGCDVMLPIKEHDLKRGLSLQPYRQYLADEKTHTYTTYGTFIHTLKYDERADERLKLSIIEEIAARIDACDVVNQLIDEHAASRLVVIPAPSSVKRELQPVRLLAQRIANAGYVFEEPLSKKTRTESKNRARGAELDPDEISCKENLKGLPVLLVDDTYGEGATLRACIRALKQCGAGELYFLSVCKNVYGGMKGSVLDDDNIH